METPLPSEQYYQFAGASATNVVTFAQTPPPVAGNTITINGTVYTYGTDFNVGSGTDQMYSAGIAARRFAERVNGMSDDARFSLSRLPNPDAFARVAGLAVLLFARVPGTGGNALTLATSNSAAFAVGGANFSGGSAPSSGLATGGASTVTVNNVSVPASTAQVIPSGAKGWTVSILTGTATLGSATGLPAGFSDSDVNTLAASLTLTTDASSSAYVRWNT